MLEKLDEQVSDCLQHAADCAERAKAATTERERKDWLELEGHYLTLVRSIEFTRRLARFSDENRLKRLSERAAFKAD